MKYTLITGSANGLGKEFAKLYAEDNNNLLLVDYDEKALIEVKEELVKNYPSIKVETIVADLSKKEELVRVKEYVESNNYFINNLVNSAGFGDRKDFIEMDIDKQMKIC